MQLYTIKALLRQNPDKLIQFVLPDGDQIPIHFHVTEVGHVAKDFVDCGVPPAGHRWFSSKSGSGAIRNTASRQESSPAFWS